MDLYNLVISAKLSKGGGGGDIDVDALTVTENGVYTASSGHAFSPVTVSVPQSGITPTGTSSITTNGIYDITSFASVDVNVSGGGGGDHDAEDGIIQKTISGVYTNSRVTNIGFGAFRNCSALTTVNFPNATDIGTDAFRSCSALTTVNFPNATDIGSSAFISCFALMSAYFLASSVASLNNLAAFYSTPMSKNSYTGSFGSIYVPASLVDSYKAASNWSTYAARITSYVE